MSIVLAFLVLVLGLVLLVFRIALLVRGQLRPSSSKEGATMDLLLPRRPRDGPIRVLILLGSGGHTAEMLRLLRHVTASSHARHYSPFQYLITAGDLMSEGRVCRHDDQPSTLPSRIHSVPRARRVGQSWITTSFTTLWSLVASARIIRYLSFDALVCNGPGTCVPLALLIFFPRVRPTSSD